MAALVYYGSCMTKTDSRSAEAAAYRRLYKTARWKRLRKAHLMASPLCCFCLEADDVTEATIVDHIKPYRGDMDLFFDAGNLQSLCKPHHDSTKQRIEHGKKVIMFDAEGWPI